MTAAVLRIAVLRALPGIGDLLCAVPALRAVRAAHPLARVTLVGLPSGAWMLHRFPDLVDGLLPLEGVPGLPEVEPDPPTALRFVETAQRAHFDLALQLHGSGTASNLVLSLLGARRQVSAHLPGQWRPPGVSVAYPHDCHEIDRMLSVVTAAGCPPAGHDLELPLSSAERREAARLTANARHGPGGYVCLHPGASRPDRCWSPSGFAAVGDHIVQQGFPVVLTGAASDHPRTQQVCAAMRQPALDLSGQTNLGTLGAVFRQSRLVVTNDTGASHVAVAVGAPSVVVAGSSEPTRWAPLDGVRHPLVTGSTPPAWPTVTRVLDTVDEQIAGRRVPGNEAEGRRLARTATAAAAAPAGG